MFVNVKKRSISTTIGRHATHLTIGPNGSCAAVRILGAGLFYSSYRRTQRGNGMFVVIMAAVLLGLII